MKEPHILQKLISYNFFPKIISSFQDYENIYLVTTYFEGVSLDSFRNKTLSEEQIKFVSACVIQSLIYLRKEKIIHRDIMMKNIIMDEKKYFNVIDFSFSINYDDIKNKVNDMITYDMVTPPEILNKIAYNYNSDYYRLGSIIYYLIFKSYPNSPYIAEYILNKKFIFNEIFINYTFIKNYSNYCIDFLNKLLISNYTKRIGYNNISELKNHLWFQNYNWDKLEKKIIKSPFDYQQNDFDQLFCTKFSDLSNKIFKYKLESKKNLFRKLIKNYDFTNKFILKNLSN